LATLSAGAQITSSADLVVYAASSLEQPLQVVLDDFAEQITPMKISIEYASSNELAEKIAAGAQVDVFLSAGTKPMIAAGNRATGPQVFATDELVVAFAPGNPGELTGPSSLNDWGVSWGRCADDTECGALTKESLQVAGISSKPTQTYPTMSKLVEALASAELDAGVVYASHISGKPEFQSFRLQDGARKLSMYQVAIISDSSHFAQANDFVRYLFTEEVQLALTTAGLGAAPLS
jgi:molybdate transport system substrate-binding protein